MMFIQLSILIFTLIQQAHSNSEFQTKHKTFIYLMKDVNMNYLKDKIYLNIEGIHQKVPADIEILFIFIIKYKIQYDLYEMML